MTNLSRGIKLLNLLALGLLGALATNVAWAEVKVGVILDPAGKDDKSFNASAYEGSQRAQKELGVSVKVVESTDVSAFEGLTRTLARKDYDLIIGIGIAQADAIRKVAKEFPQKHFAIVDAPVDLPNVRSLLFAEHEGSYLVGAAAAMKSKTGVIGFIGGMDVPLIRRFQMGYEAGAKHVNPQVKVLVNYVGVTVEAWRNPAKGKELALSQIAQKADVIYAAAGNSGMGLFDAAEEKKIFAIGVDSNQNWIKPGLVLTSMLKHVDNAVYDTIRQAKDGKFVPGKAQYGLSNAGIDFAKDQYNQKLFDDADWKKLEQIKKEILTGKISVPDFYKLRAAGKQTASN